MYADHVLQILQRRFGAVTVRPQEKRRTNKLNRLTYQTLSRSFNRWKNEDVVSVFAIAFSNLIFRYFMPYRWLSYQRERQLPECEYHSFRLSDTFTFWHPCRLIFNILSSHTAKLCLYSSWCKSGDALISTKSIPVEIDYFAHSYIRYFQTTELLVSSKGFTSFSFFSSQIKVKELKSFRMFDGSWCHILDKFLWLFLLESLPTELLCFAKILPRK